MIQLLHIVVLQRRSQRLFSEKKMVMAHKTYMILSNILMINSKDRKCYMFVKFHINLQYIFLIYQLCSNSHFLFSVSMFVIFLRISNIWMGYKEGTWLSPMTKTPTLTENKKKIKTSKNKNSKEVCPILHGKSWLSKYSVYKDILTNLKNAYHLRIVGEQKSV